MFECYFYVLVDPLGNYVVAKDRAELRQVFEEQYGDGSGNARGTLIGARVIPGVIKVPRPESCELLEAEAAPIVSGEPTLEVL